MKSLGESWNNLFSSIPIKSLLVYLLTVEISLAKDQSPSTNNNNNKCTPSIDLIDNLNVSTRVTIPIRNVNQVIKGKESINESKENTNINIICHREVQCNERDESVVILNCENAKDFQQVLARLDSSFSSLKITNSSISTLNLTELIGFPELKVVSITHSNLQNISGELPKNILHLNLSSNLLNSIPDFITITSPSSALSFPSHESTLKLHGESISNLQSAYQSQPQHIVFPDESTSTTTSSTNEIQSDSFKNTMNLEVIDVTYNNISELPQSIFKLPKLKAVYLKGNNFEGSTFVWERLYEWVRNISKDFSLLQDADDTLCHFRVDKVDYKYSVLGALKAKEDLETTCQSVNKSQCWNCSLHGLQIQKDLGKGYPISHEGRYGKISISLNLDCSNRSLTTLPLIPIQTWQLNVSHNKITDLSSLKKSNFQYLMYLDADNNEINFSSLAGIPFIEKYRILSLRNNHMSSFPLKILESIKSLQDRDAGRGGGGETYLGGNEIDCDTCENWSNVMTFLRRYEKNIKDVKDIYCNNFNQLDDKGLWPLVDLPPILICAPDQQPPNFDKEIWVYVVIFAEILLIAFIIAKVWYDQRTFRRTGKLPWCSKKIPPLPCGCDTILEGIKEQSTNYHSSQNSVHNNSYKKSKVRVAKTSRSNSNSSHSTQNSATRSDLATTHGTGSAKQASWV